MLDCKRKKEHTHYFVHLTERYSEYEVTHKLMVEIDDRVGDERAQMWAAGNAWRLSGDWDEVLGGWWFDGFMWFPPTVVGYLTYDEQEIYSNVLCTHPIHIPEEVEA